MPKTPVESDKSERYNPYLTKGISKRLQTPHMQIGLSRKKKTPKIETETLNTANLTPDSDQSSVVETPLGTKAGNISKTLSTPYVQIGLRRKSKTPKSVENLNFHSSPNENVTPYKQVGLSKDRQTPAIAVTEDLADLNTTPISSRSETIETKITETDVQSNKTKRKVSKRLIIDSDSDELDGNSNPSYTSESKVDKKKLTPQPVCMESSEEFIDNVKDTSEKDIDVEKIDSVSQVVSNDKEQQTLLFRKASVLCVKLAVASFNRKPEDKAANDSEAETEVACSKVDNEVASCSKAVDASSNAKTEVVSSNKPQLTPDIVTNIEARPKKFKRSLSMKKSSENIEEKKTSNLSPSTVNPLVIKNLQTQILLKRKLVDELKQAEIYKKKHDLKELQQLTNVWKSGCISAIYDLLNHMQTHVPIDMATLLQNLRIPPGMISLSEKGELI